MPLTSRGEFLARALLLVLVATAPPALPQVPGDFLKITNLELSSGTPTLEYENVGQKPVTAFAIENLTELSQFAGLEGGKYFGMSEGYRKVFTTTRAELRQSGELFARL